MKQPFVREIRVGLPKTFGIKGAANPLDRPWKSGILKEPVKGPVWLGKTNLSGDGQADLRHHGGPEKAVFAYAENHYPMWQKELQIPDFTPGAFGENFVMRGQTEANVCIGDTYQIGEAIIQVTQPRQPCWKPARRWRIKDLAVRIQQTGRTGWYFRVLEEGYVEKGQPLDLLERPYPQWTIAVCNDIMHRRKRDRQVAEALAACPLLSSNWKRTLSKRAATGENPDERKRLIGPNAPK